MKHKKPLIGIIGGTGKMGLWFKNFFESNQYNVQIAGRATKLTPEKLAKIADITVVSAPISQTEEVIKKIIPFLRKTSLLTDITSLKVLPLRAMEQAECATLGMHPLFGPTTSVTNGQKIVFCRQKDNKFVDELKSLFEKSQISVIEMSAEEHDYHMAYIQALTHALNLLYAKIIFDQKDAISRKLNTPLFMLQSLVMGRVLHQDLTLSADIQMHNPYFIPLIENFAAYSKKLLSILQAGRKDAFISLFQKDQEVGRDFANYSILHTDKILRQVSEVHVSIPETTSIQISLKKARIAFLGPEGTYSHQATELVFHKSFHTKVACDTIFDVFCKVLDNDADFGLVPAENSIEGTVKGTLDYLVDFSLYAVGSFAIPIHHQFASFEKKFKDIEVVISHPQALAQCEQWIRKNLPHSRVIPSPSTTASMQDRKKRCGYICSLLASRIYKIPIIRKNIEDNPQNTTRFYIIAKNYIKLKGVSNKKTLIFLTVYNRVGILRDILNVLANHGINLTKLESRPSYEKVWDYHFFVEVEKEYNDGVLSKALKELEIFCPVIRILGQT